MAVHDRTDLTEDHKIPATFSDAWKRFFLGKPLINEHLEAELAELYATAAHNGLAERRNSALH